MIIIKNFLKRDVLFGEEDRMVMREPDYFEKSTPVMPTPKEEPTLSGFGIISSSGLSDIPAPNNNSVFKSVPLIFVENLFEVLINFNK